MAKQKQSGTIDDAQRLFQHAEGFRAAEQCLINRAMKITGPDGTIPKDDIRLLSVITPSLVICSVRLEFLLKTLLILDNGEYPKIHDLNELFNELTIKTQGRLHVHYDKLTASFIAPPNYDMSIEGILKRSCDAFVKFRYFPTESFEHMQGFVAHHVSDAVMMVISEDHPDWIVE